MKSGIKDCINSFAKKTGCPISIADRVVRDVLDVIKEEIINNGGISLTGSFSIEVVNRKSRKVLHPVTGKPHVIPACRTLKLTVGKHMKEELNKSN